MTTIMFQSRFAGPLQAGTKRQTIRPPRKRPIKVGERLSLRRWQGKAYRSSQVKIIDAECTGVFDILICATGIRIGTGEFRTDVAWLDEFARGDGFSGWGEMRTFFASRFGYGLPFEGTLIEFGEVTRA